MIATTAPSYIEVFHMEDNKQVCPHSEITNEGVCITCGVDITTDDFMETLMDIPKSGHLGDLLGMVNLARATAEGYLGTKPQLRWAGVQLIRVPEKMLWVESCRATFPLAKEMGYKGDETRWTAVCKDYLDLLCEESE